MTRKLQRERERNFVEHLKELYPSFPSGEIIANVLDPPDIVVKGENCTLGIEVTELFPRMTAEEKKYMQRNALETLVIEKAKSELLLLINNHFQVDITFKKDISIRKQETNKLAESICRVIIDETEGETSGSYGVVKIPKAKLPSEIEELKLIYSYKMTTSCWNYGHGTYLRELEVCELVRAITKKNKDISKKEQDFPVWLLIVEPHDKLIFGQTPSLLNGIDKQSFAKVFFLRTWSNSLIVI